ncbi:MAG: TonB-dependent receptor, partial [Bacteroidetes bacterium]|nr:TonB-dependent receptor [Bacteroidota bacterium]MBU1578849.1 TonB-dependent receptor [Bacteroidota bacterium]
TLRMPDYRRVDIGFSKQLIGEHNAVNQKSVLRHVKNMWLSLEVFNLLQVNNTVSYIWIKDVNNQQYAVPNYLTPRQLNLKLLVEF